MCDSVIHDEFKREKEHTCPFCDQILAEVNKDAVYLCCCDQDLQIVNGFRTCTNCGSVHSCDYVSESFEFYRDLYKIRRKSIYHRKYHVCKVLADMSCLNNVALHNHQIEKNIECICSD